MEEVVANLVKIFEEEVTQMQEMFSSVEAEQAAILKGDTEKLQQTLGDREPLLENVETLREQRKRMLKQMGADGLESLKSACCSDSIRALALHQQLLELIEKVRIQTERNNYLIEGKLDLIKQMIQRLVPSDTDGTYRKDGTVGKRKECSVALINREV